jgi:hypothetical protein
MKPAGVANPEGVQPNGGKPARRMKGEASAKLALERTMPDSSPPGEASARKADKLLEVYALTVAFELLPSLAHRNPDCR